MSNYKLYTDGSYNKPLKIANMGGYLLSPDGEKIFEFSVPIPIESKDGFKFHETLALSYGLRKCLDHKIKKLDCFSDDSSLMNICNQEFVNPEVLKITYRAEVLELKKQFETITFTHLNRKFNKDADKLAGKALKIYRNENFKFKKRSAFSKKQERILKVPNLLCEEDFLGGSFEEGNRLAEFSDKRKQLVKHYLVHIGTKTLNFYEILRNPKNHKNITSTLLASETVEANHLHFSSTIKMITDVFNNIKDSSETIGLMFDGPAYLRKPEMILRQRDVTQPNHPLLKGVLEALNKFPEIILHNNEKLIKAHQVLLDKNDSLNGENIFFKNKEKISEVLKNKI